MSTRSRTRTGSSRATASRRSGCCAGCRRRRSSRWWRGHPAGWWNPADYNLASICVPIATQVPHAAGLAWGKRLRGESACALTFFGDGATSEGAFHEGANFAAVMRAPLVLLCNNNQWAISTPLVRADERRRARRQGGRLRHPGTAGRRRRRARRPRGDAGGRCARARRRAGRPSSRRSPTARRRTRPRTTRRPTSTWSGSRRSARTSVSGASRATSAGRACSHDDLEQAIKAEAADVMRAGIAAAEAEPPARRRAALRARARRPAGVVRARPRRAAEDPR